MKKTHRILALLLSLCLVVSLAACSGGTGAGTPETSAPETSAPETAAPSTGDATSISLWVYPVGGWGDETKVKALTDAFTAETGISVKVEYLAYADGDDKVNTAITAGNQPDLILEGPERLVANWGANGYLVDLADMLDDTDKSEIIPAALAPCINAEGKMYEYPMCMTAHCMAINLDAFKAAGADQYIDLETRTWSTDNFIKAVEALYAEFGSTVGAVYCGGQGGDQGTRALINNMYGGTFTNADHTAYTWDDPKNIQAIEQLLSMDGIAFDASLQGGDEIAKFYQGALKMAFCWNSAQQINPNTADTGEGKTVTGEEIVYMNFPTADGSPAELCGGIWGFGIFDKGDAAKIEAAKKFIKFMCDSPSTADAVSTSTFFAARTSAEGTDLTKLFDNEMMNDYAALMLPNLGDYYNVIKGWAAARTEWWNMLQEIGNGADMTETIATHMANANAAAAG